LVSRIRRAGPVELNDELQGVAWWARRNEPAHPSLPPSVHQAGPRPGNDRNSLALDAELIRRIGLLRQDDEPTVWIHRLRLGEPSLPQLGAVDACVSLASDDGAGPTIWRRRFVAMLAYRNCGQPPDHVGKILRLRAADHATLNAQREKCRKYERNASPPHILRLSGRLGDPQ
jgi:hypothetical protein